MIAPRLQVFDVYYSDTAHGLLVASPPLPAYRITADIEWIGTEYVKRPVIAALMPHDMGILSPYL